jgi:hypothetical protein
VKKEKKETKEKAQTENISARPRPIEVSSSESSDDDSNDTEDDENGEGYEVEEVTGTHMWKRYRYWKVKWVGDTEETWEPNKNILSAQSDVHIKAYKSKNPEWMNESDEECERICEKDYQEVMGEREKSQ